MPWSLRWHLALRQTFDPGKGLSAFLSRVSIVGMALAIALLLIVQSVMNGFDREMRDRILALVPHVQVLGAGPTVDWPGLAAMLDSDPGVVSVRRFVAADSLLLRGQSVAATQLTGVDAASVSHYGALLSPAVEIWDEQSLVLGAAIVTRLGLRVGDRLSFILPTSEGAQYQPLNETLTAVLESGTQLDEVLALVNRQALSPYLGSASTREGIAIQLADVFAASDWRWRVYEQLPAPLQITDWRTTHGNLYSAIQLSRDLVGMILFIVILVAAFNVVSSLMLVVTDRRRAVAMLMAMGGRGTDLTAVFFLQGGLIGLVGALAGMLLGYGLAISTPDMANWLEQILGMRFLQTDVYPLSYVPVDIRWQDFMTTSVIAIGLSVLAAVLPALRAASLPIAETLAH